MLFNSIPYLILFSLTYLLYWNIPDKGRKPLLLLASLCFYSYFSFIFLFHFLFAILVNYGFSIELWKRKEQNKETKSILYSIVTLNILNLAFFKYFYFVTGTLFSVTGNEIIRDFGKSWEIFLPLAISFYSFQLIALQVDIHRGVSKTKISIFDYFLFILFFPQLIAGPIMRTDQFLPQIDNPQIDPDRMKKGLFLIIGGLFKKVVIAENIAPILYPLYSNPSEYDSLSLYLGVFGFAIQIFCDFSGYTDIARGSANLLGYEIPDNFFGPFLARSFRELWGRWHVTLSTWLRDYLYISLGGNRSGLFRSNVNLLVTMGLGGLWHGASLNFLFWGLFLGIALALERTIEMARDGKKFWPVNPVGNFFRIVILFHIFAASGVFFRTAANGDRAFSTLVDYYSGLFQFWSHGKPLDRVSELPQFIALGLLFNAFQYYPVILEKCKRFQNILLPIFATILVLLLGIFGDGGGDFIYFQF